MWLKGTLSNRIHFFVLVFEGEPISLPDVRFGKVAFPILEHESNKCNYTPFFPPFSAEGIFVQLAASRSSEMAYSLLQAVTIWLEWANSTGFAACVEMSGRSDEMRVNIASFVLNLRLVGQTKMVVVVVVVVVVDVVCTFYHNTLGP